MHADPQSEKRQSSCQCLFVLWGSALVKASSKVLVKLTSGLQLGQERR